MIVLNVRNGMNVRKQMMKQNEEKKFVGVHLEAEIDEYLSLWVMVHYTRRTKVIRGLLDEWMKKQTRSKQSLLDEILRRTTVEWNAEKPELLKSLRGREDKLQVAFELFRSEQRRVLSKKGLNRKTINELLGRLEI